MVVLNCKHCRCFGWLVDCIYDEHSDCSENESADYLIFSVIVLDREHETVQTQYKWYTFNYHYQVTIRYFCKFSDTIHLHAKENDQLHMIR